MLIISGIIANPDHPPKTVHFPRILADRFLKESACSLRIKDIWLGLAITPIISTTSHLFFTSVSHCASNCVSHCASHPGHPQKPPFWYGHLFGIPRHSREIYLARPAFSRFLRVLSVLHIRFIFVLHICSLHPCLTSGRLGISCPQSEHWRRFPRTGRLLRAYRADQ